LRALGATAAFRAEEKGPRVTAREIGFIRELAGEGLSAVQIGRRLGLTPFAVRGVLTRTTPLD
jgi:DNA-binding CsgD family transcriptional regulator